MSSPYENKLSESQIKTILRQPMFFVATASKEGMVNLSPKGHECFYVLNPGQVCWIDYPGSGNETALHLQENPQITLMFCDFFENGYIVRLYGKARSLLAGTSDFERVLKDCSHPEEGFIRQIFLMDIQFSSNSCGSGVPIFNFKEEGVLKKKWAKIHEVGQLDEIQEKFKGIPRPHEYKSKM